MTRYVFDTNILSWLLAADPAIISRMNQQIKADDVILGCPIVWYEVRRGLLAKDARRQMQRLDALFATFLWQDYRRLDWRLAAELWAFRRAHGLPINDADLLIGVFTRNREAILVTDNVKDFAGLDVSIENWKLRE
ncbi:MAG: PIN domain-containing protein [Anaerolineae bacterium]|nr:PIN domain-containing protein [Anaerolineae bacterium]